MKFIKAFLFVLFLAPVYAALHILINIATFEYSAFRGPEIQKAAMRELFGDDVDDLEADVQDAVDLGNSHSS